MRILLSNDDSVHARGILVLAQELRKIAEVTIVAPTEEKSTTGHSLTLHKPLRIVEMGKRFWGVNGSPADCINMALKELRVKPDLVISGINRGANLGQDVYYSGTVSAAREACMLGIPSIAVSLAIEFSGRKPEERLNYGPAAKVCARVVKKLFMGRTKIELPFHTMLNLNVPDLPLARIKGVQIATQGFRKYAGQILKRVDHRGKPYFWVGGQYKGFFPIEGTDCVSVDRGYAAITPLKLDTTDEDFLGELGAWVK